MEEFWFRGSTTVMPSWQPVVHRRNTAMWLQEHFGSMWHQSWQEYWDECGSSQIAAATLLVGAGLEQN